MKNEILTVIIIVIIFCAIGSILVFLTYDDEKIENKCMDACKSKDMGVFLYRRHECYCIEFERLHLFQGLNRPSYKHKAHKAYGK